MKKNCLFTIAAASLLTAGLVASCQKESLPDAVRSQVVTIDDTSDVELSVSVSPQTKASSGTESDEAVNTIQVLIFSPSGELEISKFGTGNTIQMNSTKGAKHIWAVVNRESALDVATESALKAYIADLKENTMSNILMAGYNDDVEVGKGSPTIVINVNHMASKIILKKVKVDFTGSSFAGQAFIVKDIYLKNVAGSASVDGTASPSVWYNKLKMDSSTSTTPAAVRSLIQDTGLNISVTDGAATAEKDINRTWFTFPNPSVDADGQSLTSWSPRSTRLVIHATLGGSDTYYTFTLPKLERNKSYEIKSITLKMKGKDNDNDDEQTVSGTLEMNISVNPWTGVNNITYEY